MPTIFDKYEIHFDGNNLWCDYPIIIGVNGTNTTKLIFDAEAGIESFMLNTRTGGALAYEPVNDVVTVNPPASYAGEDYDCLVMLEAGNYHLQVSIVETPYFHDEDTEEQADDNTEEIVKLNATVNTLQENFNNLNDSVGNLETAMQTAQQDIAGLEMRFDDLQTFYVKSSQTRTGNVKPGGDPYSIPASALSLLINIVGSSYSEGEIITFEFYPNTTDESPAMKIPCRVLSTGISNLDVLVDFAAGTFSIYETDISQTPAKQLTKKLANGFNVMRTYPHGYKKIDVKTSATHETPNTMFMIVRSLF